MSPDVLSPISPAVHSDIAFATTVSGKALGAVAGLAIICTADAPGPAPIGTPRYLELAPYAAPGGVPFTQSSLLVGALATAIASTHWPSRFAEIARADAVLRAFMQRVGHRPLVAPRRASPAVATWCAPAGLDTAIVGRAMANAGFHLSWHSSYLRARGWIQTAMMGDVPVDAVPTMAHALADALDPNSDAIRTTLALADRLAVRDRLDESPIVAHQIDERAARADAQLSKDVHEVGAHGAR